LQDCNSHLQRARSAQDRQPLCKVFSRILEYSKPGSLYHVGNTKNFKTCFPACLGAWLFTKTIDFVIKVLFKICRLLFSRWLGKGGRRELVWIRGEGCVVGPHLNSLPVGHR